MDKKNTCTWRLPKMVRKASAESGGRHIWLPWNEWFRLTNTSAIVVPVITVGCSKRRLSKGSCLCYTRLMCNPVKVSDVYIPTKCLGLCYWWTFLPRKPKQINLPSYWPIEGLNKIHKRDHEVWATENGGFIYNGWLSTAIRNADYFLDVTKQTFLGSSHQFPETPENILRS